MKKWPAIRTLQALLKKAVILVGATAISVSIFATSNPLHMTNNSAASDTSLAAVVSAINDLQVAVSTQLKTLIETLTNIFWNANNNDLTTRAQQANLATLNPEKAFQFTGNAETPPPGSITSIYNFIDDRLEKSASQKILASLQNMSQASQDDARKVLLAPLPNSKSDAISPMDTTNAQILLSNTSYSADEQNKAERTVSLMSDYASPLGSIDLVALTKDDALKNSSIGLSYRTKMLTLSSMRSLFMGSLYKMLNDRIPIKDLGTQVGIPNTKDASLTQVLQYIASKRVSNPEWYSTMNTAPEIVVNREVAYILAEMQWQLYLLHRDNERMLQTMTATGILNLRNAKMFVDHDEITLQTDIQGTTQQAPTSEDLNPAAAYTPAQNTTPANTGGNIPSIPQ